MNCGNRGDAQQTAAFWEDEMRQLLRRACRRLSALAGVFLFALAPVADAQTGPEKYPDRPIKIIVPFPAGGSVDALARVVAHGLSERWGQQVIVEARPGASTMVGTGAAAKAEPDGYTLLMTVSNLTTNPALYAKVAYDAQRDFAPIAMLARTPVVLYATPSLPANNLAELVALAKTRQGGVDFGSAGVGTMTHLTAEQFKIASGAPMTHVLYRGGAPALNDLIAGHLALQFGTVGQAYEQYRAGQVKALAISSAERYPSMKETPTFAEQGFDVVVTEWYGLFAPAATPKPIIAKLNAELKSIIASPDVGRRMSSIELTHSTPEELDAFVRAETERWGALIKKIGITAQ
jgi:tripartite-type tricarboxylate transporter receptor subunit TctC